nr:MATE family efflux transporter [Bacillus subtilis]
MTLAVMFGVIVYLISDHLIGLFTNDPQLIKIGGYILHVTFLSIFITGMSSLFTGIFQATAQGTAAFVMSFIQGITLIPVLFIANQVNGFHGVVWSLYHCRYSRIPCRCHHALCFEEQIAGLN